MLLSPVCTPQPHTHCAMRWHNAVVSASGLGLGSPFSAWAVSTSDWRPSPRWPQAEAPWEWRDPGSRGCPQESSGLHQYGRREHQPCLDSARLAHRTEIPSRGGKEAMEKAKKEGGRDTFIEHLLYAKPCSRHSTCIISLQSRVILPVNKVRHRRAPETHPRSHN